MDTVENPLQPLSQLHLCLWTNCGTPPGLSTPLWNADAASYIFSLALADSCLAGMHTLHIFLPVPVIWRKYRSRCAKISTNPQDVDKFRCGWASLATVGFWLFGEELYTACPHFGDKMQPPKEGCIGMNRVTFSRNPVESTFGGKSLSLRSRGAIILGEEAYLLVVLNEGGASLLTVAFLPKM